MEFQLTFRRPAAARPAPVAEPAPQEGPQAGLPANRRQLARERVSTLTAPLAVTAGPAEDITEAYLVNADGSGIRRLTHQPRGANASLILGLARLGSDAILIARQISPPDSDPLSTRLYRLALSSGALEPLTSDNFDANTPAAARDGSRIAFARKGPGDANRLYLAAGDGHGIRALPSVGASDDAPAFSPNGQSIAFTCYRADEDICVVGADGRGARRLTHGSSYDSHPTWSPEGSKLTFSRDGDIWTMRADGRGLRRLTRGALERDTAPAWSSDGKLIAFVRADAKHNSTFTGPGRVMLIHSDGRGLVRVNTPRLRSVRAVIWR
jgi:dipeptidyl aminopeptidase/acylaminoacyl peptidase